MNPFLEVAIWLLASLAWGFATGRLGRNKDAAPLALLLAGVPVLYFIYRMVGFFFDWSMGGSVAFFICWFLIGALSLGWKVGQREP